MKNRPGIEDREHPIYQRKPRTMTKFETEANMPRATWKNGSRSVSGRWVFDWAANRFVITLDQKDRTTGQQRVVYTYGDSPEWGNWKLKPDNKSA